MYARRPDAVGRGARSRARRSRRWATRRAGCACAAACSRCSSARSRSRCSSSSGSPALAAGAITGGGHGRRPPVGRHRRRPSSSDPPPTCSACHADRVRVARHRRRRSAASRSAGLDLMLHDVDLVDRTAAVDRRARWTGSSCPTSAAARSTLGTIAHRGRRRRRSRATATIPGAEVEALDRGPRSRTPLGARPTTSTLARTGPAPVARSWSTVRGRFVVSDDGRPRSCGSPTARAAGPDDHGAPGAASTSRSG